jgi:hypothetical protein
MAGKYTSPVCCCLLRLWNKVWLSYYISEPRAVATGHKRNGSWSVLVEDARDFRLSFPPVTIASGSDTADWFLCFLCQPRRLAEVFWPYLGSSGSAFRPTKGER